MSHMTQKLLAEKVQALLPEASARVKLTAQVISDLELGYSGALGLTVKQLRAIAHVLDRAFVIEQENIERPISIDGNTTLEMLFRKGVRLSLGEFSTQTNAISFLVTRRPRYLQCGRRFFLFSIAMLSMESQSPRD